MSSSFFFELKRKKYMKEMVTKPQGSSQLENITKSYPMKVLDRHTKNIIYKTIK